MLENLTERSREEAKVMRFESGEGGVGAEVEAGEERREWQRPENKLLVVLGGSKRREEEGEGEGEEKGEGNMSAHCSSQTVHLERWMLVEYPTQCSKPQRQAASWSSYSQGSKII